MKWSVTSGDILEQPADVLICSANVFLNLSGGVGGAILRKTGSGIQQELYEILRRTGRKHMSQGDVVMTASHGLSFKAVIHAIAVDGFYQSSPSVISKVTQTALHLAASANARNVVMAALATGYGKLPMNQFAAGIRGLQNAKFPPVEGVTICVKNDGDRDALQESLFCGSSA